MRAYNSTHDAVASAAAVPQLALAHTPCRSPKHISVEGVALTALLVRSRAQMADASFAAATTPRPPNCIAR